MSWRPRSAIASCVPRTADGRTYVRRLVHRLHDLGAPARDELGLSPDGLLDAWGRPALDTLAEHAEALDAAEPDPEGLELLMRVLGVAWRRHSLNDPTAEVDDDPRAAYEAAQRRAHDDVDD